MSYESAMFNMLITDLQEYLRKRGWGGVRLREEKMYPLAYADDIVIMTEREDDMRSMIARLENYVRVKGLMVNIEKSKILRFSKGEERGKKVSWR